MSLIPHARAVPNHGAVFAALAFTLFTGMDCTVRAIGGQLHVFQVVWMQTIVMFGAMLIASLTGGGWRRLRTSHPFLHVARGLLAVTSISLVFASYARLPLSDVYAVLFTVPLLVSILGVPLLGERVSRGHWLAITCGLAGVLVMTGPFGADSKGWEMLLPIGGAFSNALGFLLVRRMQRTETTESMGVYGNLVVLLAVTPVLPYVFEVPSLPQLSLSIGGGLFGAAGFACLVLAYRSSSAASVAPFQYSQILWAVLLGFLLFQDQPDARTLAGAAIAAASGYWLLNRRPGSAPARDQRPALLPEPGASRPRAALA
jgi:drug/metabolite transporter (DMT)-like permease